MTLPVLIYITSVNYYAQRLQFNVYNIDQSVQAVEGDVNLLQWYIQEIEKYRCLASRVNEFGSRVVNLEQQIVNTQRQIQESEQKLSKIKQENQNKLREAQLKLPAIIKESHLKLQEIKNKNQLPQYNEKIIKAISTETKTKTLVGSLMGIGLGLYLAMGTQGDAMKMTGGVVAGISGLVALSVAPLKSVIYQEKFKHMGLKAEAQRVMEIRENAENRNKALIKSANCEFAQINRIINKQINEINLEIDSRHQLLSKLQLEYSEAITNLQVAKLYADYIIKYGSNIVFGEENQIQILNKLIYSIQNPNQVTDEDLVAGAMVVGVIGLAAIGLYKLFKD